MPRGQVQSVGVEQLRQLHRGLLLWQRVDERQRGRVSNRDVQPSGSRGLWAVLGWVHVHRRVDVADAGAVPGGPVQLRCGAVQQLQRRLHVRRYVHVADTGSVQSRAVQSRWLERVPELHKRVRVW